MGDRRHELKEQEWLLVADLLPKPKSTGRPGRPARDMLNGMMWILMTGAPWRDLPGRFGPWETVYRRFREIASFLNELDPLTKLRRLVAFYVTEHNSTIPHAAFEGQTPDEVCFGTGAAVPDQLARQRAIARRARVEANRERRCATCA